jgi:hypothetical protein
MNFKLRVIKSEIIIIDEKEFFKSELKNITEGLNKDTTLAFLLEKPMEIGKIINLELEI